MNGNFVSCSIWCVFRNWYITPCWVGSRASLPIIVFVATSGVSYRTINPLLLVELVLNRNSISVSINSNNHVSCYNSVKNIGWCVVYCLSTNGHSDLACLAMVVPHLHFCCGWRSEGCDRAMLSRDQQIKVVAGPQQANGAGFWAIRTRTFLPNADFPICSLGVNVYGDAAKAAKGGNVGESSICPGLLGPRPILMPTEMIPIGLHPSRIIPHFLGLRSICLSYLVSALVYNTTNTSPCTRQWFWWASQANDWVTSLNRACGRESVQLCIASQTSSRSSCTAGIGSFHSYCTSRKYTSLP